MTNNSLVEANTGAITGQRIPIATKANPHKVIKAAKGTINILAITVIGEKILKYQAINPIVPNQAERETKKPSTKILTYFTFGPSLNKKDFSLG